MSAKGKTLTKQTVYIGGKRDSLDYFSEITRKLESGPVVIKGGFPHFMKMISIAYSVNPNFKADFVTEEYEQNGTKKKGKGCYITFK